LNLIIIRTIPLQGQCLTLQLSILLPSVNFFLLNRASSSEFKEAFPAGRFRPVCKIQAKRGASSSAIADTIKAPEWWHSTRIIQAFDAVLQDRVCLLILRILCISGLTFLIL
jgi:hypothetical protein